MNIEDYLEYNKDSPSGLVWKIDRRSGRDYKRVIPKGYPAGTCSKLGYWKVKVNGKLFPAHQCVWVINNGEIPRGNYVDHIDGNPSNNHISNLRLVTPRVSSQNRKKMSSNTSGVAGVSWTVNAHGTTFAVSKYSNLESIPTTKSFSVRKFGLLEAFYMACLYRKEAIESLNKAGQDYTERHGE